MPFHSHNSEVVMGVAANREDYLPTLCESIRTFLPDVMFIVQDNNAPLRENFEALRKSFAATNKRYWLFLDDDIRFLSPGIVHNAVAWMQVMGWGMCGVYQTNAGAEISTPYQELLTRYKQLMVPRVVNGIAGIFMLVDALQFGHVPLAPYPCNCCHDAYYSLAMRNAGAVVGMAPELVYHVRKHRPHGEYDKMGPISDVILEQDFPTLSRRIPWGDIPYQSRYR